MSSQSPKDSAVTIAERLYQVTQGVFEANIVCTEPGIAAGMEFLDEKMPPAPAGSWYRLVANGDRLETGQALIKVFGSALELGVAEDYVMGTLGFTCGIATRASAIKAQSPNDLHIACGGWKKLPAGQKPLLRSALATAGILPRLVAGDFVYLSKNAVTLLGGVGPAIKAGRNVGHGPVAVQVKNVEEAEFALEHGAGVIMVDTGNLEDLKAVNARLQQLGCRNEITLAFGGGVRPEQLQAAREAGADTVDIGRAILDAPLLDLRMQIKNTQGTDDGATHEQENNTRKPVLTVYHNSTRS